MKKILISLGILSLLLITIGLTACVQEKVICNSPYIKVGTSCCLDNDNNSICDKEESVHPVTTTKGEKEEVFDCSSCEPEIVEREVVKEVKKYVCEKDNSIVDKPEDCLDKASFIKYDPVTTNENNSRIEEFKVRPACRDSQHAAEIYFKTKTPANNITFQIKENPVDRWKDIYTYDGGDSEEYLYFALCIYSTCSSNVEFYLQPNKKYLMRAKFDYENSFGETQYSNEWVVDATSNGDFMTKLC